MPSFERQDRARFSYYFFFNDTATTEIYTLSLHDALPISLPECRRARQTRQNQANGLTVGKPERMFRATLPDKLLSLRSEEHTSELQSRLHLVCRLLLEKKNNANSWYIVRAPTVLLYVASA